MNKLDIGSKPPLTCQQLGYKLEDSGGLAFRVAIAYDANYNQ